MMFLGAVVAAVHAVLAAVFLMSGIAKLVDSKSFRRALEGYALFNAGAVALLTPGVPLLELVVALAWLLPPAFTVAPWVTAMTLAGFSVSVLMSMRRGRRVACGCGGLLHSGPLGWPTIARNAALVALAALPAALPVEPAPQAVVSTAGGAVSTASLTALLLTMLLGFEAYLTLRDRAGYTRRVNTLEAPPNLAVAPRQR